MNSISPTTVLENGTNVSVGLKKGVIEAHEILRDQFDKPIVVHTVRYTEKFSHRFGNRDIYKPFTKTERVNYSFINLL